MGSLFYSEVEVGGASRLGLTSHTTGADQRKEDGGDKIRDRERNSAKAGVEGKREMRAGGFRGRSSSGQFPREV